MRSARGVYGFVRYMGPHNGGVTQKGKSEYSDLLRVFLSSASFRWFADTYLTSPNLKALLGDKSSEIEQLKTNWYCFKVTGCKQDNSTYPIMVWIKKLQFWQEESLEDGIFKTMIDSMSTQPVLVNNAEDTLQGPRNSQRKPAGIDLHCTKTHGCAFVSKHQSALKSHESKCRPKAVEFVCKTRGCEFVTSYRASLTNHTKTCAANKASEVAAQPVVVAPKPKVATLRVQVFACSHRGCSMTHPTKKASLAHQRTHTKKKPEPKSKPKHKPASKNDSESDKEESSEDTHSDDAKEEKSTPKQKRGSSKKPPTVEEPTPATVAGVVALAKLYRCSYPGCDKSHATSELAQYHQRKHQKPISSPHEGAPPGLFRCPECPKSHATADLARLHQHEHQASYLRSPLENEMMTCPECQLFRGTGAQVVAHIPACREALTCPECHKKLGSQALLIVHVLQCLRGDAVAGRKRPREDDENWKPTRNRNNKNEVRLHWQKNHVQDWLVLVELEEYGESFLKEKVDGRILLQLTEEAIKDTGLFGMKATHAAKFLELRAAFN